MNLQCLLPFSKPIQTAVIPIPVQYAKNRLSRCIQMKNIAIVTVFVAAAERSGSVSIDVMRSEGFVQAHPQIQGLLIFINFSLEIMFFSASYLGLALG